MPTRNITVRIFAPTVFQAMMGGDYLAFTVYGVRSIG